eukprot:9367474-Lingulodinium_polyedra.AAC.1
MARLGATSGLVSAGRSLPEQNARVRRWGCRFCAGGSLAGVCAFAAQFTASERLSRAAESGLRDYAR